MIFRLCLAALLLSIPIRAEVTLDQLRSEPPSNARNFMIWQYFDQNITSGEADDAFYLIHNVNRKLFLSYAKKSDRPEVVYTAKCMKMGITSLENSTDPSCVKIAASIVKLSVMPPDERDRVAKLTGEPGLLEAAQLLNDENLSAHYRHYAPALFWKVFNGSSAQARDSRFNFIPDYDYVQRLAEAPGFSSAVIRIVTDDALSRLAWALTKVEVHTLNAQTLFYLGLNQLLRGKKSLAIALFQRSGDMAYYQSDKDKALFWQALASENDLMWKALSESWDIDFYSLYAKQKVGTFPDNYYSQLETSKKVSDINLSDPFEWDRLLDTIRSTPKAKLYDLAQRYDAQNLTPVQSFIVERASGYRLQGYIMPYDRYLKGVDTDTKALVYALMRRESRFIPSALSRSYALGLMQIMPFLCRALDDNVECGRKSLNDMFDPRINLLYALPHIAWLKKRVYHPLFVAYAYNGGIGFTRRHLMEDTFRAGPYEPFMSMELMQNAETREYGKKVLTNYVIYKKILGEPVSLIDLCRKLLHPSKTDVFRSAE